MPGGGEAAGTPTRVAALDGLRGLAVLFVLASHASNAGFDLAPGLHAGGLGRPGVFLFFVLSSFLLTGQLLGKERAGEPIRWGRFAARRGLRILPAYAFALGIHVIVGAMEPRPALEHLALIRSEHHFWTIPVEVLFYGALPILVLGLRALGRGPGGMARRISALVLVAIAVRWAFPPDFTSGPPRYAPNVLPFLPIFLVGSILALLEPWLRGADRPRRLLGTLGWAATGGIALLTPSVWSAVVGEPVPHTRFHLWFDPFALLWGCVLAACVAGDGLLARAVSWSPLGWLGQVSYSVYLMHALVLGYFVARAPELASGLGVSGAFIGPLFLGAAVGAGALSYALVERPFLGHWRGLGRGRGATAATHHTAPRGPGD